MSFPGPSVDGRRAQLEMRRGHPWVDVAIRFESSFGGGAQTLFLLFFLVPISLSPQRFRPLPQQRRKLPLQFVVALDPAGKNVVIPAVDL